MMSSSLAVRLVLALVVALLCLGPVPSANAAEATFVASSPPALFAGITDYVIGNRSRMVQAAFVAFGVGILILVTATRKH